MIKIYYNYNIIMANNKNKIYDVNLISSTTTTTTTYTTTTTLLISSYHDERQHHTWGLGLVDEGPRVPDTAVRINAAKDPRA